MEYLENVDKYYLLYNLIDDDAFDKLKVLAVEDFNRMTPKQKYHLMRFEPPVSNNDRRGITDSANEKRRILQYICKAERMKILGADNQMDSINPRTKEINPVFTKDGNPLPIKQCISCKSELNLQLCTRCRLVYYCNEECQRNDWDKHKIVCHK